MTQAEVLKEKLKIANDLIGEAVLFDILHMRTEYAYKKAFNTGTGDVLQHSDYKEIVEELKNRYESQLKRLKNESK